MASLVRSLRSGRFCITFRFGGKQYTRALDTADPQAAEAARARVDEALDLLARGLAAVPPDAEPGAWIVSGGRLDRRARKGPAPAAGPAATLGGMLASYRRELPPGAKAASTLQIEAIHLAHIARHLGGDTPLAACDLAAGQRYLRARMSEPKGPGRRGPVTAYTATKELKGFLGAWSWCADRGLVPAPPGWRLRQLTVPRDREPEPFRTTAEIRAIVARGGLPEADEDAHWGAAYLTGPEIRALLAHARAKFPAGCTHPLLATAAYTGARRSELCRVGVDDVDFRGHRVVIREMKRVKGRESRRLVDLHPDLAAILRDWLGRHPGGQRLLAKDDGTPLLPREATARWEAAVRGTEWARLRGLHVLRHSFCSCLASAGVDQRVINAFVGHQSEATAARYRHLFPAARQSAILALGI